MKRDDDDHDGNGLARSLIVFVLISRFSLGDDVSTTCRVLINLLISWLDLKLVMSQYREYSESK